MVDIGVCFMVINSLWFMLGIGSWWLFDGEWPLEFFIAKRNSRLTNESPLFLRDSEAPLDAETLEYYQKEEGVYGLDASDQVPGRCRPT